MNIRTGRHCSVLTMKILKKLDTLFLTGDHEFLFLKWPQPFKTLIQMFCSFYSG